MKWHELALPPINLLNVPKICGGNMEEVTITISLQEYANLLDDKQFLNCLINAGVNNWEGYDFAREMMEENT